MRARVRTKFPSPLCECFPLIFQREESDMADDGVGRGAWRIDTRVVVGGDDLDEGCREQKSGEEIDVLRHGSENECVGWW